MVRDGATVRVDRTGSHVMAGIRAARVVATSDPYDVSGVLGRIGTTVGVGVRRPASVVTEAVTSVIVRASRGAVTVGRARIGARRIGRVRPGRIGRVRPAVSGRARRTGVRTSGIAGTRRTAGTGVAAVTGARRTGGRVAGSVIGTSSRAGRGTRATVARGTIGVDRALAAGASLTGGGTTPAVRVSAVDSGARAAGTDRLVETGIGVRVGPGAVT
ncbi:hypothetical protein GCM10022220_67110 [Actinocatenispora rupis]|uniref:Uncharacterized protein n=1 Tax=Actinocatenispora rupis TaxID=519421 RepID=A0A8J3NA41_9ACTN|nr:hypothetical protein Aru02nite_28630 [Actinocatenispora rupis]